MSHTLLLADDSATIQRVVELAFANEDIDVVTVGDGARAIEAIARDEPDIVLADVSMPGKDGYEVASFVRSDPARARIPVVLLTGAFEPLDEARCGAIGRHEVLVKPFEPRQMIGRVRELLELPAAGAPDAVAAAEALVADRADAPADIVPDSPSRRTAPMRPRPAKTTLRRRANVVPDPPPADETGAPAAVSDPPVAAGADRADASASRADDAAPAVVPDPPPADETGCAARRFGSARGSRSGCVLVPRRRRRRPGSVPGGRNRMRPRPAKIRCRFGSARGSRWWMPRPARMRLPTSFRIRPRGRNRCAGRRFGSSALSVSDASASRATPPSLRIGLRQPGWMRPSERMRSSFRMRPRPATTLRHPRRSGRSGLFGVALRVGRVVRRVGHRGVVQPGCGL